MFHRLALFCGLTALSTTAFADAGDIVGGFNAVGEIPSGVGWDGTRIWVSYLRRAGSGEVNRVIRHDPETGAVLREVAMPAGSVYHNLSFTEDGDLWTDDLFRTIVRLDGASFAEEISWSGPGWVHAVTYDSDANVLYMADFMTKELHRVDFEGTVLATVTLDIDDDMLSGSAWDGTHLWIVGGTSDTLYRVNPTTGVVVDSFEVSGGASGIAWDGSCLWVSDTTTGRIDRVDHGQGDLVACVADVLTDAGVADAGAADAGGDSDAGPDGVDAGVDGGPDSGADSGLDSGLADAGLVGDAGFGSDAGTSRRRGSGCSASGSSGSPASLLPLALLMVRSPRRKSR